MTQTPTDALRLDEAQRTAIEHAAMDANADVWRHCRLAMVADTDWYRRNVAVCTVRGRDLGAQLVREGLAISETNFGDPYRREENAARRERRGVWR